MDRRGFFKTCFVNAADEHASQRATHWIRPPYALAELDFLLACTRCNACIEACPHQVIFPLPARLGMRVIGTPALDLLNKGCHLCDGWPCVKACEPGALRLPEETAEHPRGLPDLAAASINTETCLPYSGPECGACASSCPVPGALIWDTNKPRIDPQTCTGCGLCREACIVTPKAIDVQARETDRVDV